MFADIILPIFLSFLVLSFGACGGIPGSDKTSSSSSNTTTTINTCNEDGTVNDQSSTVTNPTETTTPTTEETYTEVSTPTTTTDDGIRPVVPGNGIGVIKSIVSTAQANECAENHLCKILKAEGNTATIEHCSNVTIIVGSDYEVEK